MPATPLDEKISAFKDRFPGPLSLFHKGRGIINDLRLKKIETDGNRRLSPTGRDEMMREAAHGSAILLNGHRVTLGGMVTRNGSAKAVLKATVFGPESVSMDSVWAVRAWDYLVAQGGEASRTLAQYPELLAIVLRAPIPFPGLPKIELDRLADEHVAKAKPAEIAHIADEAEALGIVEAQLRMAEDAVRGASGFGQDHAGFARWLVADERQPSKASQAALMRDVAKVESDRILTMAKDWDEPARADLYSRLLDVRVEQTA
jgi:hypothetical protein